MLKMKLGDKEKLVLRNKAKDELKRLDETFNNHDMSREMDNFKNTFLRCEVTYKIILEEHQYRKYGKRSDRLKVDMTQAPYALLFAGYDFDKKLLADLFGGEDNIGKKSVKKLRDNLTHKVNQTAINELLERKDELYGYMNAFIEKIRTYDLVES